MFMRILSAVAVGIVGAGLYVNVHRAPKVPATPPEPKLLTATRFSVCKEIAGTIVQYDNGVVIWFKDPAEAFADGNTFMRDNTELLQRDEILQELVRDLGENQRVWVDVSSDKLCGVRT